MIHVFMYIHTDTTFVHAYTTCTKQCNTRIAYTRKCITHIAHIHQSQARTCLENTRTHTHTHTRTRIMQTHYTQIFSAHTHMHAHQHCTTSVQMPDGLTLHTHYRTAYITYIYTTRHSKARTHLHSYTLHTHTHYARTGIRLYIADLPELQHHIHTHMQTHICTYAT